MPSPSIDSVFIRLYHLNGAPWNWPVWQDHTGISDGLFPEDDNKLPPGWSRNDASDVESYFNAFLNVEGEEKKNRFVTGRGFPKHPGREIWRSWIRRQYKAWGLHGLIVKELQDSGIHPQDISVREENSWPDAEDYVAIIFDSIGLKLFGEEAFPENVDILPKDVRSCLKIMISKSWADIRLYTSRLQIRADKQKVLVEHHFQGMFSY